MKTRPASFHWTSALALALGMALPLWAASIPLVNPGFEQPGTGKIATGFNSPDIPGWANAGPSGYNDTGVEGGGVGEGSWKAFLQNNNAGAMQVSGHTIVAGDAFTLTYNFNSGGNFELFRTADNGVTRTALATIQHNNGSGTKLNQTLSYTATGADAGMQIGVRVFNGPTTGAGWIQVDNIRLDVIPPLDPKIAAPEVITFTNNGAVGTFPVSISNIGASNNLVITAASVSGADAAGISVATSFASPLVIAPGASGTIQLQVDPFALDPSIDLEASLDITSNGWTTTVLSVPIEGIIRDPWVEIVNGSNQPIDQLNLGSIPASPGTTSTSLKLKNFGVTGVEVYYGSLSDGSHFSLVEDLPTTPIFLAGGGTGNVTINFDAQGQTGLFRDVLTLESDDLDEPTQTIDLLIYVGGDLSTSGVVYLSDTVTGGGTFSNSDDGALSTQIVSGTTTVADAVTYTSGIGHLSRVGGGSPWPNLDYGFTTPRDLKGLVIWNYQEFYNNEWLGQRGLKDGHFVITHSGGESVESFTFDKAPNSNSIPAQIAFFSQTYTGVSKVRVLFAGPPAGVKMKVASYDAGLNQMTLNVTGTQGFTYNIFDNTDLQEWNLVPGTTISADGPIVLSVDPNTQPKRFFRLVSELASGSTNYGDATFVGWEKIGFFGP